MLLSKDVGVDFPKKVRCQPGDRVYPSGQVWDQGSAGLPWVRPGVPHHDMVMELMWLVRVEARRVPPAIDV